MIIKIGNGQANELGVVAEEIKKHLQSLGLEIMFVYPMHHQHDAKEHTKTLSAMVAEGFPVTIDFD
jgi:hypothetical protein